MRCKVGDLAIIIAANELAVANIGRIVHVDELLDPAGLWYVSTTGSPLVTQGGRLVLRGTCADWGLRPLPGDILTDSIPDKITEKA